MAPSQGRIDVSGRRQNTPGKKSILEKNKKAHRIPSRGCRFGAPDAGFLTLDTVACTLIGPISTTESPSGRPATSASHQRRSLASPAGPTPAGKWSRDRPPLCCASRVMPDVHCASAHMGRRSVANHDRQARDRPGTSQGDPQEQATTNSISQAAILLNR